MWFLTDLFPGWKDLRGGGGFLGTAVTSQMLSEYNFDEECSLFVDIVVSLTTRQIFTSELGHICMQLQEVNRFVCYKDC